MQKRHLFILSVIAAGCVTSAFAARSVDVEHLASLVTPSLSAKAMLPANLQIVNREMDFNKTTHIRLQQTYQGYPVWGGEVIEHVPQDGNVTQNGMIWEDLNADLSNTPQYIFKTAHAESILKHGIELFQGKTGLKQKVSEAKKSLIVYVDDTNKAHWAYWVSFLVKPANATPKKPTFIIDAVSYKVYQTWDDIQTVEDTYGGGFGGNPKMGKLVYDGLAKDLPRLNITRDAAAKMCNLQNTDVTVKDVRKNDAVMQYACDVADPAHNNVYWSGDFDSVNGAYSPGNDALYIGAVVKNMYQNWYNIPVLTENGKPMMLNMRVHENMENAYWDGSQMTFGDGGSMFYPLVSLGVGAHEISHGFTQQHSNLKYFAQPGGLNESFSDMAAQAAEFYSNGTNSWQIGPEIVKGDGALRYMDDPTKDCNGKQPGNNCSIANVKDYHLGLDVHYSSGIFNKVFYLIGTANGWDTRKAFDVMVQANLYYWTSLTRFEKAACGVVKATKDYKYPVDAVNNAFANVGIDTTRCK